MAINLPQLVLQLGPPRMIEILILLIDVNSYAKEVASAAKQTCLSSLLGPEGENTGNRCLHYTVFPVNWTSMLPSCNSSAVGPLTLPGGMNEISFPDCNIAPSLDHIRSFSFIFGGWLPSRCLSGSAW